MLPWQTKWYLIEIPDEGEQFISAFRGEFCDEAAYQKYNIYFEYLLFSHDCLKRISVNVTCVS